MNYDEGLGFQSVTVTLRDGTARWNYYKDGGGMGTAEWMTLYNGWSAVLEFNMNWSDGIPLGGQMLQMWQILEKAEVDALVPASWSGNPSYYGKNDGCDCGLGAWDPDCTPDAPPAGCAPRDTTLYGCSVGQNHCIPVNNTGVCAP